MMRVGGIVLCGGESRRMGRPKAWLPFGPERMLERVVRIVGEATAPVLVVAAPDQDVLPLPADIEIVRDAARGRGPLQGLAAGLEALQGRAEAAYLSSCDVPFLQAALIRKLIDLLGEHSICVPHAEGFHHPLAAVYRIETLGAVQRLLSENRLRPAFLFDCVPTRVVEADELRTVDRELASLWNMNTPEEYQAALTRCTQTEAGKSLTT